MARAEVVLLALLAACDAPKRDLNDALADPHHAWRLSRDEWQRAVVEPYRGLHDDYLRVPLAFGRGGAIRAHVAGDPRATFDQAVTRWALPTLAPTKVVDGIDAVFVEVGGEWRAIVGLGTIVRGRVAALDAACARALDAIDPAGGRCIEAAWAVADAALREDRARFAHACGLAANLCGKRSP